MAGILDWLGQVQQPDIVGSFYKGQDMAQQRQRQGLALLAQKQQMANQSTLRGLAGGIARNDMGAVTQASAIDPDYVKGIQSNIGTSRSIVHDTAGAIVNAPPEQRPALWAQARGQVMPALKAQNPNIPDLPEQWDDATMLPVAQALFAQTQGQSPEMAPHVVGNSLVDSTGKELYRAPEAPAKPIWDSARGQFIYPPDAQAPQAPSGGIPPNAGSRLPEIARYQAGIEQDLGRKLTPQEATILASQVQNGDSVNMSFQPGQPPQAGGARVVQAVPPKEAPQSEIEKRIALAKSMGATDAEVKGMVIGGGAAGKAEANPLLTPDGQEAVSTAMQAGYTIPLPTFGMGAAAGKAKADAINALAKKWKDAGISALDGVTAMIQGKTATAGLTQLQKTYAGVAGWEESAKAQAKIALTLSNDFDRTNYPLLNRALLAGKQQTGDSRVDPLLNSVNTLAEEYAKVIGAGNAAATDSARALAHQMFNTAQSQQQFQAVVDNMLKEMSGRTAGLQTAISHQRTSVLPGSSAQPPAGAVVWTRDANGKLVRSQ